jgi:hypothetical protein
MMNRQDYRQYLVSGTVTFPSTFPQLGRIRLIEEASPTQPCKDLLIVSVEENPSPRVSLVRSVMLESIRAVFVPRDPRCVHIEDGKWLLEDEILQGLCQLATGDQTLFGIVFVPESVPSLLQMSAGMTAAESIQYYPPLPGDPSHNHYNAWPSRTPAPTSCLSEDGYMSCSPVEFESALQWPYAAASCASAETGYDVQAMRSCKSSDPYAFPSNDLL